MPSTSTSVLLAKAKIRPGLKARQVAYDTDAAFIIEKACESVSGIMGFELSMNNPAHLGLLLEFLSADHLAGLTGNSVDPRLTRFPGNWA